MSSSILRSSGFLAGGAAGAGKATATLPASATKKQRAVRVSSSSSSSASFASSSFENSASTRILGNGAALWLPRDLLAYDVLVGQNFVVHRPKRGGPGLVPSPRPPAPSRQPQPKQRSMDRLNRHGRSGPPAARRPPFLRGTARLLPAGGGDSSTSAFFDVTDYSVVETGSSSTTTTTVMMMALPASRSGGGGGGGLAARPPHHRQQQQNPQFNNDGNNGSSNNSPRRTRRVAWTCNLCGGRKVSPVNPLAWDHGAVFFRCGGCDVVHKVKDNLGIFHELAGQVYPPSYGQSGLPPRAAAAAEAAVRKWNQGKS